MHPFDSVLSAMQLESSLFVRLRGHAPWAISFDTGGQARLVVVAKGQGWFTRIGQPPVAVKEGHCLIIKQGVAGILGDAPDREAIPCWEVADHVTGNVVTFGGDGDTCEFFSTLFTFDHAAGEPLAALLPDVVHVSMPDRDTGRMLPILEQVPGAHKARGLEEVVVGQASRTGTAMRQLSRTHYCPLKNHDSRSSGSRQDSMRYSPPLPRVIRVSDPRRDDWRRYAITWADQAPPLPAVAILT